MSNKKKLRCVKHGNKIMLSNFYMASDNSIFSGIGYIPICKNCIWEMVEDYYEIHRDIRLSVYYMCRKIDVAFSNNIFEGALKSSSNNVREVFQSYMRQYNSLGQENGTQLSFDNGEHILSESKGDKNKKDITSVADVINNQFEATPEIQLFWGEGLANEDYFYLDDKFDEYTTFYECDTPVMEELFKQAAFESLEIRKKRKKGVDSSKNLKNLQQIMGSANIRPNQETGANAVEQESFGTLIKKWENEKPIPEPEKEWKDVDGIKKYIETWFLGHLCKILNIKNDYSEMYEKEMQRYRVSKPSDTEGSDT